MPAAVLTVVHHNEHTTRYENVQYWPWRDGVSVWRPDGSQTDHHDVLEVFAGDWETV